jgi:branched-chain amino acid transport system ATP-binding protein
VLLSINALSCAYDGLMALRGVSISVGEGELVCVVGRNGAGKSTLLRAISGVQPVFAGTISFNGVDVTRSTPPKRVISGIVQVPEGRQVFSDMSVEDNLRLGGYRRRAEIAGRLEQAYEMFPILRERRNFVAGSLSGGQQQMLVVARALMSRPRLLMLDEPSMGLAPQMVAQIFKTIQVLKKAGTTILLVEQNAAGALALADRGYVLETGHIALSGTGKDLLQDSRVRSAYLGN